MRGPATTNLDERDGVDAVLGGNLEANSATGGLGVPLSLGTGLNQGVDLVVVRSGEDAGLVGGGDGGGVGGVGETDGGGEGGDVGVLDVEAGRGTSQEALVADDGVDVGGGALEQVEEAAEVELGLLEVQVELGTLLLRLRQEGEGTLKLQALGEVVGGLDLSVKGIQGVPRLGEGDAWSGRNTDQQELKTRGNDGAELEPAPILSVRGAKQLEMARKRRRRSTEDALILWEVGSTVLLIRELSLDLLVPRRGSSQPPGYVTFVSPTQLVLSHVFDEADGAGGYSYRARGGLVVAALASHLEGNIVGGVALDLDGTGGQVVEVLVEQLKGAHRC